MARVSYSVSTDLDPKVVWDALTEFGPRRAKLWPDLSPESFKVLERGDNWARVKEGTASLGIWSIERYVWKEPVITATVEEANAAQTGGTWRMEVQPGPGGRHEPFELRTIEANGGHARVLARRRPPAGLRDLAWSPSSRLIAFVSLGRRSDIFEISSRGGAARRVTHTKGTEVEPDWGKSGRIAFSNGTNIYTIAANGRDLRVLTRRK